MFLKVDKKEREKNEQLKQDKNKIPDSRNEILPAYDDLTLARYHRE